LRLEEGDPPLLFPSPMTRRVPLSPHLDAVAVSTMPPGNRVNKRIMLVLRLSSLASHKRRHGCSLPRRGLVVHSPTRISAVVSPVSYRR